MESEQINTQAIKDKVSMSPIRMSDTIGALAGALAKAQGQFVNPKKNKTVKVKTKAGYEYEFTYATFDAIMDAVREPLSSNGLAVIQALRKTQQGTIIATMLMHESGEWMSSEVQLLIEGSNNQDFGSAITYMKRYALSSMIGISADEDDDGNAGDGNEAKKKEQKAVKGGDKTEPLNPMEKTGNKDFDKRIKEIIAEMNDIEDEVMLIHFAKDKIDRATEAGATNDQIGMLEYQRDARIAQLNAKG